jgi:hypothetical protein
VTTAETISTDLVPVEPEVEAEVVTMTKTEAKALDKKIVAANARIGDGVATLLPLMKEAQEGKIWTVFEFPSISAYFNDRITFAPQNVEQRKLMAKAMDGAGLTTRAIASALNVGKGTVSRDLAEDASAPNGAVDEATKTGIDGKDRPAKQPKKERADKMNGVSSISVLIADLGKDVRDIHIRRKSFTDTEIEALATRINDLREIALELQAIIKEHAVSGAA